MSDEMYCTSCGARISPGASFCPECGVSVSDMTSSSTQNQYPGWEPPHALRSKLETYGILTIIYAVLAILGGISVFAMADAVVDAYANVYGMTFDTGLVYALGAMYLISGIAAFIGGMFARKGKNYRLTIALYVIASVAVFTSIICLLIGLLMTYLVSKCRPAFTD